MPTHSWAAVACQSRTWSKNSSGPAAARTSSAIVPSTNTNSMRTGRSDRFAHAWFVPRWTTASPGPARVSHPSTSSSHVSPSSPTPTSTVSVRCIGDSAPGCISVNRTSTPPAGGGVRNGRSVGSGSFAVIGDGVRSVIQTSWNAAEPMSSVFGVGASDSTTDLPEASWPVTIRRGVALIGAGAYPRAACPTSCSPREQVAAQVDGPVRRGQAVAAGAQVVAHRRAAETLAHARLPGRGGQTGVAQPVELVHRGGGEIGQELALRVGVRVLGGAGDDDPAGSHERQQLVLVDR